MEEKRMKVSDIKRLISTFSKDVENAIDFSNKYSCRANDIIVLPIPIAPTTNVDIPDTVEINTLAKAHDIHCDQAIVICVGEGLLGSGDQYGIGYSKNMIDPGNIILMKMGQWGNVVIHKHTVLRQITPGNIVAIQKEINIFANEDQKSEMIANVNSSISKLNNN